MGWRNAADYQEPARAELIREAAQGEILHIDSGIVSALEGRHLALFFTGREHAGENLEQVLARRARDLKPPVQMCRALPRNTAGEFSAMVANWLAHARRQFVDAAASFPDECLHALETPGEAYRHDATARERGMSPQERLAFHQEHSGPPLDDNPQGRSPPHTPA